MVRKMVRNVMIRRMVLALGLVLFFTTAAHAANVRYVLETPGVL